MSENRTLIQITQNGPVLLIDTASTLIQIALVRAGQPALWETASDEAGTALFSCTKKLLARAALKLSDIATFIFCDGPGSVLGIRTAATAIRAWRVLAQRPAYSYCSLDLLAHYLSQTENARNQTLIADARRDTWHTVTIDNTGNISPLHRVPTTNLPTATTLVTPENFRNWTPLPPNVRTHTYTLANLLPRLIDAPLFALAPEPDAFLHEEPSYQIWTPQIHQAEK